MMTYEEMTKVYNEIREMAFRESNLELKFFLNETAEELFRMYYENKEKE